MLADGREQVERALGADEGVVINQRTARLFHATERLQLDLLVGDVEADVAERVGRATENRLHADRRHDVGEPVVEHPDVALALVELDAVPGIGNVVAIDIPGPGLPHRVDDRVAESTNPVVADYVPVAADGDAPIVPMA